MHSLNYSLRERTERHDDGEFQKGERHLKRRGHRTIDEQASSDRQSNFNEVKNEN